VGGFQRGGRNLAVGRETGLVEAVGIEPSSDRLVSHDSVAIAPEGLDGETPLEPSESGLRDPPGTRVPKLHHSDELLAHARLVWGALRVI